ncbi:hypothetical protein [Streptomyces radiopugnans]|uniref:hypothetical protein n=1 Tax=Streptomyces radiopugnans TaxID=403935 RepID=UPI003F1D7824
MTYEISDAQVASFRSHGSAVIEAYLESKAWQRNRGDGPRNIWYRQEVAWDLCPYCDDPDGPVQEDPYCPLHDDTAWALLWPCVGEAATHDALRTLCYTEERGPEKILRALSLRDRDEVRVRCSSSLWPEIRTVDSAIYFFKALDEVLASAAGHDTSTSAGDSYTLGEHPYTVELVSENEVLFSFPHEEPPTRDGPPSASRRAAQRLYSAACDQMRSSNRSTHVARRYATGEWTTVEVVGPEDLPPPTLLEADVGSLIHQFGLTTWKLDEALPS